MRTRTVPEISWLVLHIIMVEENRNRKSKDKCMFITLANIVKQLQPSFWTYFRSYKVKKIYFEMKALESVENTSPFKVQFGGQVTHLEHENTC